MNQKKKQNANKTLAGQVRVVALTLYADTQFNALYRYNVDSPMIECTVNVCGYLNDSEVHTI